MSSAAELGLTQDRDITEFWTLCTGQGATYPLWIIHSASQCALDWAESNPSYWLPIQTTASQISLRLLSCILGCILFPNALISDQWPNHSPWHSAMLPLVQPPG